MKQGDALSLPKGWEIKKLGEVCEIKPPKKEAKEKLDYSDLVSFLPMEDLGVMERTVNSIKQKPLKKVIGSYTYFADNDVLLAKITPCFENGKLGIARHLTNGIGFGSSEYIVFRSKGYLSEEYLFYFLSQETFRKEGKKNMTGAVGHKRVSKEFIENFEIPLPPLPEQQRIVSILDEAFAAIARAKANAEQNLKNAKELFESYLQGVFEKKGEGWEEKKLGEVFEIKPPKKEAKEKLCDSDLVSFFPMEDLGVCENEIKPVKERRLKDVAGSYTYFAENDVLLAKITPCFENGKLGVAKNLKNGIGFGSSEYIVFRSNGKIEPEFLFYYLSRNSFRKEGRKFMSGAVGHKRVSKDWIENYLFSFPKSKEAQQTIVRQLDALRAETQKLEAIYQQKRLNLEELKKSVLQKAFAGEL